MIKVDKYDKTITPKIQKVISKNIPSDLKRVNQWVCWSWVWKGSKWTKPPCDQSGNTIDHHQSNLTFKQALKAHKKNSSLGIGISMRDSDDICGIDIDPGPDGKIPKKLKKAIKSCPSYSEVSPSGSGYRIFGVGGVETHGSRKGSYVESYEKGRYLTVTGAANGSAGKSLMAIDKVADWMIRNFGSRKTEKKIAGILEVEPTDYSSMLDGISPEGYEDWLIVGMALHHEYNGELEGFRIWDRWARKSEKYTGIDDSEAKWNSFGSGSGDRATGLKIKYLFEKHGGKVAGGEPELKPFYESTFEHKNQLQLPMDLLPKKLRTAAEEVARFVKVPESLIISSLLGIFSAAIGKNIEIVERGGIRLQPSLGFFMGIPTGGRKSGVDNILMRPFNSFERGQRKAWRDKLAIVEAEIKTAKDKVSFYRKQIRAGAEGEDLKDITHLISQEEELIFSLDKPAPRFICSDITEEELSNLMADNNETMFIQSDEGRNLIKNIIGRYSTSEAMGLYICGLTGSPYKRDRVTAKKAIELDRPCINMSVKVQQDAFLDLISDSRFAESGLAARLFLSVYDIKIHEQVITRGEKDLQESLLEGYHELLVKLLVGGHSLEKDGRRSKGSVKFELNEEAVQLYHDFNDKYSKLLEQGKWKGLEDITNKMVSRSIVLASLLTVIWEPEKYLKKLSRSKEAGSIQSISITSKMFKMGINLSRVLTQQTIRVIRNAKDEADQREAKRITTTVLEDILGKGLHGGEEGSFPGSIVSQKMSKNNRDEWREILTIIVGHGYFIEDGPNKFRLSQAAITKWRDE